MPATKVKQIGKHFTPPCLAELVANRVVKRLKGRDGNLRVMDPSCGDGNLLDAIAKSMSPKMLSKTVLVGIEQDPDSFNLLHDRLNNYDCAGIELHEADFLDYFEDATLFAPLLQLEKVDAIIANPPYVRAQVLGAKRSQELSRRFNLSGRVDLYQAFLVAMAKQLNTDGIMGVITSNRFLTTKGGASTRRFLRKAFDIDEVFDLGDTKLFEAAVLPALVFGHRIDNYCDRKNKPKFVRIYENATDPNINFKKKDRVIDCINEPKSGLFKVENTGYRVTTGPLLIPSDDDAPWAMLEDNEANWVDQINQKAVCRIQDVAKIRVGIKSTADKIFIRSDWAMLEKDIRPEEKYLFPIISQANAAKFHLTNRDPNRKILITHEVVDGKRKPIDFPKESKAWEYLVANRERLEGRKYVIDAGRRWYEIWVPQDPLAWSMDKIVFPDISPEPRFFYDRNASIVDGNCYWITLKSNVDPDMLFLILGLCNSSVMKHYHDLVFQNRLYAGRRRYLTQYVSKYPLPDPKSNIARKLIKRTKKIIGDGLQQETINVDLTEIDELAITCFNAGDFKPLD